MEYKNSKYGPTLLRVFIGVLFIIQGYFKLKNPSGPIGMLTNLGFPVPTFFAWVLLLSELIFGISVLIGWKVKYTVWPLVIVMLVATWTVVIPNMNGSYVNLMFHLITAAGLVSIYLTGPGAMAVEKN